LEDTWLAIPGAERCHFEPLRNVLDFGVFRRGGHFSIPVDRGVIARRWSNGVSLVTP
jgi:hypothetical protein